MIREESEKERHMEPVNGKNNFLTQQQLADRFAEIAKDGYGYTFEQWLERIRPNEICFRGTLHLSHKDGHEWVFTYGTAEDHSLHCGWHHGAMQGTSLRVDDIIDLSPMLIADLEFSENADQWKKSAVMETPDHELSPTDIEMKRRLETEAKAKAFKKNPELAVLLYGDEPSSPMAAEPPPAH